MEIFIGAPPHILPHPEERPKGPRLEEWTTRSHPSRRAQVRAPQDEGRNQYPSAQPSLRGSEPPVSVPLSQSIQIAWPPPSGPTTLVVSCPIFFRPSTTEAGTPSSS